MPDSKQWLSYYQKLENQQEKEQDEKFQKKKTPSKVPSKREDTHTNPGRI
jgi:hypothetical protein